MRKDKRDVLERMFSSKEDTMFKIIIKHSKILEEIFDGINMRICSKCPKTTQSNKPTGCCVKCATNDGYYAFINAFPTNNPSFCIHEVIIKIKKEFKFNKNYGFFNNDIKKCKLPRHLRSNTCLSYTCDDMKLSKEQHSQAKESVLIIKLIKKELNFPY
jgi:hypothetical protein